MSLHFLPEFSPERPTGGHLSTAFLLSALTLVALSLAVQADESIREEKMKKAPYKKKLTSNAHIGGLLKKYLSTVA